MMNGTDQQSSSPVTSEGRRPDRLKVNLRVRDFEDRDLEAFMAMGKWLQENGEYAHCGFAGEKVVLLFVNIMTNPNYHGSIVETDDGQAVGNFVGVIQEYYFSTQKIANDLCFGLLPGYRDNAQQIMFQLITRFETWAKANGATETCIATSAGMNGPKLEGFLNTMGYDTVGFTTKKRMN